MDTSFSQNLNVDVESGSLSFLHESTLELPTTMDDEQLAGIAENVYGTVMLRITRDDDIDPVPEYVADRLITAIEWASPHYEYTKRIAELVIDQGELLPQGTVGLLRKHFDLTY